MMRCRTGRIGRPEFLAALGLLLATLGSGCATAGRTSTATPGEAGSWSVVSNPTPVGVLDDVTCAGRDDCWAVGYWNSTDTESHNQPLIEHDTGSGWSIVDSPAVPDSRSPQLQAMACAGAGDCWAVGDYSDASGAHHGLIEHYTGGSWTIDPSPAGDGAINLEGVTCVSADECWAVGGGAYDATGSSGANTVIEQYAGSGWTIVPSPSASVGMNNSLTAVTCVSADDCWAVGIYGNHGGEGGPLGTLIEQYTGGSWTIVPSPGTTATDGSALSAIACVGARECWAVGAHGHYQLAPPPLIEQYTGSAWSIVVGPTLSGSGTLGLSGIDCASASDCWAVGGSTLTDHPQTLIEHYSGSGWSVVSSPSPSNNSGLDGVTCVGTADCWAVGVTGVNGVVSQMALIERYSEPSS
jgi:hypothetical protein